MAGGFAVGPWPIAPPPKWTKVDAVGAVRSDPAPVHVAKVD
jgi:hypothetical protein